MQDQGTEVQEEINLTVSEEMRSHFYEIAKWAGFLAVVGFVFAGIVVISAFIIGSSSTLSPELTLMLGQAGAGGQVALTIVFLIFAFIMFYPSLLLFKYSIRAKHGVLFGDQESLNEAFAKLKSVFKFWGVITIVYLALNLIGFISTLMGGVAAG
jgi:hypothetical protein